MIAFLLHSWRDDLRVVRGPDGAGPSSRVILFNRRSNNRPPTSSAISSTGPERQRISASGYRMKKDGHPPARKASARQAKKNPSTSSGSSRAPITRKSCPRAARGKPRLVPRSAGTCPAKRGNLSRETRDCTNLHPSTSSGQANGEEGQGERLRRKTKGVGLVWDD